jgi:hypothetical protein
VRAHACLPTVAPNFCERGASNDLVSGSTAELTAPAVGAPRSVRTASLTRRLEGGRLYLALAGVALVLGALSLLIPSTPSYDPWAWLVWGREIVHFKLQTTGGPTWKPLPVIFTTVFAPFGKAQPDLWLVVARAGALMAAAMVFKLSWRLTQGIGRVLAGERSRLLLGPALLAGVIAAVSLVFSDGFISDNALGYSEGLMTALVLIALELHLDGRHRVAFAVGFGAALDRPELWLIWGPYGLWLWWKDPGARVLVGALFVLIPVLWFAPEYWGSGHFFRGVSRAQHVRSNSPALKPCPFCSLIVDHAWPTVLLRIKVVAALAVGAAALVLLRVWLAAGREWRWRPQGERQRSLAVLVAVGALGLGWWVLIGIMTQAGFSGNDRYLVLGAALIEIAGAVGWGWAAVELGVFVAGRVAGRESVGGAGAPGGAGARRRLPAAGFVWSAVALLALAFAFIPGWVANSLIDVQRTHRALVFQSQLRSSAATAVKHLGGTSSIYACGSVMTEGFQVPMLAYTLGVHTLDVRASPQTSTDAGVPPNVVFQARAQRHSRLLPALNDWPGTRYKLVLRTRRFKVYEHCNG